MAEPQSARSEPLRSFKFLVDATGNEGGDIFASMGFMSVDGIAMNTDMLPYREGGMNTTPHKLPGQTDFSPLTLSSGVFYSKPHMWNRAKMMFAVNHGSGTLAFSGGEITQFRYKLDIRVLGHPVTKGGASGQPRGYEGAVLAFEFINCWTASVGFSGLNAQDNNILIHQMQVHHEGFEVYWGNQQARNLTHATGQAAATGVTLPQVA